MLDHCSPPPLCPECRLPMDGMDGDFEGALNEHDVTRFGWWDPERRAFVLSQPTYKEAAHLRARLRDPMTGQFVQGGFDRIDCFSCAPSGCYLTRQQVAALGVAMFDQDTGFPIDPATGLLQYIGGFGTTCCYCGGLGCPNCAGGEKEGTG